MQCCALPMPMCPLQAVLEASDHTDLTATFDTSKPEGDHGRIAVLDRAHDILGWKPEVDLAAGIQNTMEWIRKDMKRPKVLVILIGQVGFPETFLAVLHLS